MDDDGRVHAGRRKALEALVRVAQQGRRGPREDLVGVVVEGDDHRPRLAPGGLAHEVLQQVCVAQVQPVEHAHHDERRLVRAREVIEAAGDVHRQAGSTAAVT